MCRRMFVVSMLATAITCLSFVPSHAGGWDSLTFPRDHYLVGQVADVRDEFFAGDLDGTGDVTAGPYFAYLLPKRGPSFATIEPPTIPTGSISLGALRIDEPTVRDGWRYAIGSLTFTVPDVPSGRYTIAFCDDPCVHSTVGFLAFGWITIVHTSYEASLIARIERQRTIRWTLKNERRHVIRASNALRVTLGRTQASLSAARHAVAPPAEEPIPASVPTRPESEASALRWPALAAAFGIAVGVVLGRRPRRRTKARGAISSDDVAVRAREREHSEV